MSRSETAVESALGQSSSSVSERNILGQTPLHMAVGWPEGVARLIKAGADVNTMDNHSLTPLLYTCSGNCLETVQQLLDAGSALRSHVDQGHSNSVRSALEIALETMLDENVYDGDMIEVRIDALGSRRKQVLDLAIAILPAERTIELHVVEGLTLDECTSDIYDALMEVSPAIPVALYSHSRELGTVFHMQNLVCGAADQLWDAGFRDIEGFNARGLTPLMTQYLYTSYYISDSSLFEWFISKGASLMTAQRNQTWRALHFIAASFGNACAWRWSMNEWQLPDRYLSHVVTEIFNAIKQSGGARLVARTSDYCSCACSTSGCTMTISMLKTFSCLFRKKIESSNIKVTGNAESRFEYVDLWIFLIAMEPSLVAEVVTDILRHILFEELRLTHTCCSYTFDRDHSWFEGGVSAEERSIIQEEEADTIQELENLLELAISRLQEFSGYLSEFLK